MIARMRAWSLLYGMLPNKQNLRLDRQAAGALPPGNVTRQIGSQL